jgi:hypothetical protein
MADNDIVTPARQIFYEGDISYKRAVSEAVMAKFASMSNFIESRIFYQEQFAVNGFFNSNSYDDGVSGIRYIENLSQINQYYMSVRASGSSGTSAFNVAVYDNTGGFVNNLFSSPISISGSSGTNVLIGKKDVDGTPSNFSVNAGGHTTNYGTLTMTEFLSGYVLVPFIVSNGASAYNIFFNIKLKEL